MIKSLYTVPIFKKELKLDLKSIKEYCLSYKEKNKTTRVRSNKGGWQSDNLKGEHPVLNDLFLNIIKYGNEFGDLLKFKNQLNLDNIWININGFNNVNIPHTHPINCISGVFYVSVPKNGGNIRFQRPDYEVFGCMWPENLFKELDETNSPEWWLSSDDNVLYFFPSWLRHWVEPNLNEKKERISISFNLK